jgi:hypothetical protein
MKIRPTTSFNDAMKRLAEGHLGAATVLGHIHKNYPRSAMALFRAMDFQGVYGEEIWYAYQEVYGGDASVFLAKLKDGVVAEDIKKKRAGWKKKN